MKWIFFILLTFTLVSFQCSKLIERKYRITLKNNSGSAVTRYIAGPEMAVVYPDTQLLSNKPPMRVILPGESEYWHSGLPYDEAFFALLPQDTLSIYVLSADTLAAYPWPVIRDQYKVLRRYDLSLEDLRRLNFKVPYPPIAAMTGMKIWPR